MDYVRSASVPANGAKSVLLPTPEDAAAAWYTTWWRSDPTEREVVWAWSICATVQSSILSRAGIETGA